MVRYNKIKAILKEEFDYDLWGWFMGLSLAKQKEIIDKNLKTLPPDKQEKINNAINSIDEIIKLETEQVNLYKKYRIGLLQKFFPDFKK